MRNGTVGRLAFIVAALLVAAVLSMALPGKARAEPWIFMPGGYDGHSFGILDARTNRVRDVLRFDGTAPFGVVVNPRGTRAYATHYLDTTVTVIDTATGAIEGTLAACGFHWMAVPRNDRFIYVASDDGTFCKVDTVSGAVVHTFAPNPTGLPPQIAVNPQGTRLYATNTYTDTIDVYDTTSYARVAAIPTGFIEGLVVSRDGTRLYATDPIEHFVLTIDATTNTLIRSAASCTGDAYFLAPAPSDRTLYITCSTGGILEFDIDANTAVGYIEPTLGFYGLAITPDGTTLYATDMIGGTIYVISTETRAITAQLAFAYPAAFYGFIGAPVPTALVAGDSGLTFVDTFDASVAGTAPAGASPARAVLSPDGGTAYVANAGDHSISVVAVASGSTVATIPLADAPHGIALSPDSRRLYAAHGTISVIDTATLAVTATLTPPYYSAAAVVASADGEKVFSSGLLGVDVFSASTGEWLTTIPTGAPAALAQSRDGGMLYALSGNTLDYISTLTLAIVGGALINVGPSPIDIRTIALSPREDRIYLPNAGGDSIVVIDAASGETRSIVALDGAPSDAAISEDGAHLFVTVPERNALEDLATARDTVTVTSNSITGAAAIANFVEKPGDYILQDGFE